MDSITPCLHATRATLRWLHLETIASYDRIVRQRYRPLPQALSPDTLQGGESVARVCRAHQLHFTHRTDHDLDSSRSQVFYFFFSFIIIIQVQHAPNKTFRPIFRKAKTDVIIHGQCSHLIHFSGEWRHDPGWRRMSTEDFPSIKNHDIKNWPIRKLRARKCLSLHLSSLHIVWELSRSDPRKKVLHKSDYLDLSQQHER